MGIHTKYIHLPWPSLDPRSAALKERVAYSKSGLARTLLAERKVRVVNKHEARSWVSCIEAIAPYAGSETQWHTANGPVVL